jgi:hypothetical protein
VSIGLKGHPPPRGTGLGEALDRQPACNHPRVTQRWSWNQIGVATALIVTAVPWVLVAWTIGHPKPVSAPSTPVAGIVWGGLVFTSSDELRHWLNSRGTSYATWAQRHPLEAATLEQGSTTLPLPSAAPATTPATTVAPATAPVTTAEAEATTPAGTTVAEAPAAPSVTATTPGQPVAAPSTAAHGGGLSSRTVLEILGLVAAALFLVLAATPGWAVSYVLPGLADMSVELRMSALAAALSLLVGVMVAIVFGG